MDTARQQTIVGVFDTVDQAERAVDALHQAGFNDDQIGFVRRGGDTAEGTTAIGEGHKPSGAGIGAGAVIGGIIGAAAALLIPGVGPVLAGGILAPILGAAIGATAGGLIGALTEMGVPEEEARYANTQFEAGRTIVTVKADGRATEARAILDQYGAHPTRAAQGAAGMATSTGTAAAATAGAARATTPVAGQQTTTQREVNQGEVRVPVVEEQLVANKTAQETGEVEIRKNVVEETKTFQVPVRREEVHVERVAADRPVAPGDKPLTEGTIRVPVVEEQVAVEKQARVTGEVVVSKEAQQEQVPVSGTVRREEVHVDRTGAEQAATRRSWTDVMPTYRSAWQQRYGTTGGRWEDYEPAYRFGYESYNGGTYQGRTWDQSEADLRRAWAARDPRTPWEKVKDSVHDAWDRARGAA